MLLASSQPLTVAQLDPLFPLDEPAPEGSLQAASLCHVLAKHFTSLNADEALLTGLLHGLGRLYVVMRAEDRTDVSAEDISEIANSWQATIGRAILQSWGLPEPLQHAVEHQDDHDLSPIDAAQNTGPGVAAGAVSLTNVLIASKILAGEDGAGEIAVAQMRQNGAPFDFWENEVELVAYPNGHSFLGDYHSDARLVTAMETIRAVLDR